MPRSLRLLMLAASAAAVACATPSATRAPAPAAAPQAVGPAATPTASVPAETTGLSLAVEPADAELLIDGKPCGKVSELLRGGVVPLQPGLYQVSLKRPGFATWRAEVAVRSGVEPIRVILARKP